MVLRKLSQTLRITLALMVATFSSGLLQPAVAYATQPVGNGNNSGGGNIECPVGTTLLAKYELTGGVYVAESGGTDVSVTGGATSGSFTVLKANTTVSAVVVKGSTDAKTMNYSNVTSGNFDNVDLENGGGNTPAISNVKICGSTTVPTDVCPNIAGDQATIPTGMVKNEAGNCVQIVVVPTDVCPNIDGNQAAVPAGMVKNDAGNCVQIVVVPTDVCPNIDGNQAAVPAGMVKNDAGNCVFNITATPCPTPTSGGVITQNTAGWSVTGAEFVDGGVKLSSNAWSASYITSDKSYMISNALELGWTIEGSVSGASGTAIIFKTASGAFIHYEPVPYSDDFWTTTAGILPANGGGQGGPYSGSLQDLLNTGGDQSIVKTYLYFNSSSANTVVLKSLSFNCKTYTFDKEEIAPAGKLTVNVTCEAGSFSGEVTAPAGGVATYTVNGDATIPGDYKNLTPGTYTVKMFVNGTLVDTKVVIVEQCEDNKEKYSICHATGNDNNDKYVFIKSISAAGIFNGHLGESHQNGDDIIPPFVYKGKTYSQNWNAEGMAIYRNNCQVPVQETLADIDVTVVCVANGVKVTLTNTGDASGTATVNGTVHTVAAGATQEVVLAYDLGTPFLTDVTVTVGETTFNALINCAPGQGGGTPTTPGQVQGTTTTATPVVTAVQNAVLPAVLPSTGGVDSPFMILVASMLAFGATYFLQGKRLLGRREALEA